MDNRFLPLVVVAVMLALGLTLTVADFRRATTVRRPLLVALICQSLVLPALCLLIAEGLHLEAKLAVGLMLMAATPGGMLANIVSHLANGDLALNLTLTAINAVLSIFAIPAILAFSLNWFLGEGRFIPLQFDKFFAVFAMVLIPTRDRRCNPPPVPGSGPATAQGRADIRRGAVGGRRRRGDRQR